MLSKTKIKVVSLITLFLFMFQMGVLPTPIKSFFDTRVNAQSVKENLAIGKPVIASSYDKSNFLYDYMPQYGNDGNFSSRWTPNTSTSGEYWMVDLKQQYSLTGVEITWEFANRQYNYFIETSNDKLNWNKVVDRTSNSQNTKVQEALFTSSARYVKITMANQASGVRPSFYEFSVWGNNTVNSNQRDVNNGNIALGKPVFASSTVTTQNSYDYNASNIVDGSPTTLWKANSNSSNQYIYVDLQSLTTLTAYEIVWEFENKDYLYNIDISTDAINWTNAVNNSSNKIKRQVHSGLFNTGTIKARYVRISMTGLPKESYDNVAHSMAIYEFRIYGGEIQTISNPTPTPNNGYKKIAVFFRTDVNLSTPNIVDLHFDVKNIGTLPVDLKEVTLKYWFSRDKDIAYVYDLVYAKLGVNKIRTNFSNGNPFPSNGDSVLNIGFTNDAGTINPGEFSGDIHIRLRMNTWENLNLGNDYSYVEIYQWLENPKTTGYILGVLNFGQEPNYVPFTVRPTQPPLAPVGDLAISLEADKMKYLEGSEIEYTVRYTNRLNIEASNVVVRAEIPPNTQLSSAGGGDVKDNYIEWKFAKLDPRASGNIVYKVKVDQLDRAELLTSNTAIISSDDNLENLEDDKSTLKVMLFSNRFDKGEHTPYVIGYPDGEFKPGRYVTRAEVATIMARINHVSLDNGYSYTYNDIKDHWALKYIEGIKSLNLFSGYEDGSFKPNQPITRAELALLLVKYLKTGSEVPFSIFFVDSENHWARAPIEEAYRNKIITGYNDKTFRPDEPIRRDEMVTMMNRVLFRGPLRVQTPSFSDVNSSYWAFGDIEEAAVRHFYIRMEDGTEVVQ